MIEEVRVNEMASCCDVGVNMPQDINNFGFLPNVYSRRNKQNLFSQDRKAVFAQGNLPINLLSYLQKYFIIRQLLTLTLTQKPLQCSIYEHYLYRSMLTISGWFRFMPSLRYYPKAIVNYLMLEVFLTPILTVRCRYLCSE